jgi:hypothetical protein
MSVATSIGKKTQTPTVLQTGEARQNFFFPRELYRRTYSVCISNGKSLTDWPSVIVAWTVNISELSV